MAGWSLFEKRDVDALSRVVSACSLDGYKLRAKLSLKFARALTQSEAEEVMMHFARGFAATVETQLCGGELPFDNMGLQQRITELVKVIPQHRVRVSGLHVLREDGGGPPESSGPAPSSRPTQVPLPGSSRPAPTSPPASSRTPLAMGEPRAARRHSGFLMAAPSANEVRSEAVGRALAGAVRAAAASLLLAALDVTQGFIDDPLRFLDGRVDRGLQGALSKEACACVAYLLYEALAGAGVPPSLAVEVVQCAERHAASGDGSPRSELSRYLALQRAGEEFTRRFCGLLGAPEPADMSERIERTLGVIRHDVQLCSERICERLLKTG